MKLPDKHAQTTLEVVRTVASIANLVIAVLIAQDLGIL